MATNAVSVFSLDPRTLDRIEQVIASVLYALLVVRVWPAQFTWDQALSLLLLVSEGAVVLFLLIRRPTDCISSRSADWLYAAAGTFLPLLVATGEAAIAPKAGALLLLIGMLIHIGAKLSLNRSFGLVAANRGIKENGFYRVVRHPMYAGYMMTHAGFLLLQPSWWNLGVYLLVWSFLLLRIRAEERVLNEDQDYRSFATRVRYRLLPGVY